jgi:hypothetical protein
VWGSLNLVKVGWEYLSGHMGGMGGMMLLEGGEDIE